MKSLNPDLNDHISGEVTTLCRCWIIETVDGEQQGFTDHDEDVMINDVLCERDAGAESSSVEEQIGLNIDTSEITGALQSDRITAEDIIGGKYDAAKISTYLVNWSEADQWFVDQIMLIGHIGREDGVFKFDLQSMTSRLDQTQGRHFIRHCQVDLGDAKCGVDLDNPQFRAIGSVIGVKSVHTIEVSGLDEFSAGWFAFGQLRWTSGVNSGRSIELSAHAVDGSRVALKLWQAMPKPISDGDQFEVTSGCDKSFATCKSKFSNAINFRGFPHMPGDGFALSRATASENFDGGPVIP